MKASQQPLRGEDLARKKLLEEQTSTHLSDTSSIADIFLQPPQGCTAMAVS